MRVSEKASLNGWFRPQTLVQKLDSTFSGFDSTDSLIMISSSAGQTALSTTTFVELGSGEEWKPLRRPIPSLVSDEFYDNNIYLCRNIFKFKVNKVKFIHQFLKLLKNQLTANFGHLSGQVQQAIGVYSTMMGTRNAYNYSLLHMKCRTLLAAFTLRSAIFFFLASGSKRGSPGISTFSFCKARWCHQ